MGYSINSFLLLSLLFQHLVYTFSFTHVVGFSSSNIPLQSTDCSFKMRLVRGSTGTSTRARGVMAHGRRGPNEGIMTRMTASIMDTQQVVDASRFLPDLPLGLLVSSSSLGSLLPFLSPSIVRAVELGAFPAIGMNLVTVVGLQVPTPPKIFGALQHFSAGILLTTISKELLPEMVHAEGFQENVASGVGFFSGVGVLILLGILLPDDEEEQKEYFIDGSGNDKNNPETELSEFDMYDKQEEEEMDTSWTSSADGDADAALVFPLESMSSSRPSLRNRRISLRTQALLFVEDNSSVPGSSSPVTSEKGISLLEDEVGVPIDTPLLSINDCDTNSNSNSINNGSGLLNMSMGSIAAALPTALLIAITIDSTLDGLLIGISTAVDPDTTGPLLSASLTVESSFLGLTVATALRNRSSATAPNALLWLAASLAPAGIIAGSVSGGGLAPLLANSPVLLAGVLGFGTSTILFMVAEELLLQAHEDGSEHVWWVDFQLYTGFFASVMIEKFVGM